MLTASVGVQWAVTLERLIGTCPHLLVPDFLGSCAVAVSAIIVLG